MPKTPFVETETYMPAGDVGGTKTRLGLFRLEDCYPVFDDIRIFSSAAYPDLESVVEKYLFSPFLFRQGTLQEPSGVHTRLRDSK